MKKFTTHTVALMMVICTVSFGQIPTYVPSSNLISWWPFDGNGNDASSTGNNFTNMGGTLAADRFSNANSAYEFDGISQYLTLSNPSFSFGQASSFSVSFWMQRPSTSYGVAMMNGSVNSGNFIWNFQIGGSGNFQFGTNKQGSAWYWAADTYTPPLWEHFVGTYSNGTMVLYKNGIQVTTTTNSHTGVSQITHPFFVGRGISGAYFDGIIDDIGIWDRVLTQAEVTDLFVGCTSIGNQPNDAAGGIGSDTEITISSSNPLGTYQWQMEVSNTFLDVTNSGQFTGANSDTLHISNLSLLNNGSKFRCIIEEGSACEDTSAIATLSVCDVLTQDPRDTIVYSTSFAEFTVQTNDPMATFQWQTDLGTGFFDVINGGQYAGANSPTLAVNNLVMANSGQLFRCILNPGVCADTSQTAQLTVAFVSLEENLKNENLLSIYPNPAKDILNIKIDPSIGDKSYSIINSSGKVIQSGELLDGESTLHLKSYSAGYYILKVGIIRRSFVIQE